MPVEIMVEVASEIAPRIWEAAIEPRDIRAFGGGDSEIGDVSVLLLTGQSFDREKLALRFNLGDAHSLNIGRSTKAIIIGAETLNGEKSHADRLTGLQEDASSFEPSGSGDRRFLAELDALPDDPKRAGQQIVAEVRRHFHGDLKPLGNRRFREMPDTFWFVTIRPRVRSLDFSVRGLPDRFNVSRLQLRNGQRGYSEFKVHGIGDVAEAVAVILAAKRKGR